VAVPAAYGSWGTHASRIDATVVAAKSAPESSYMDAGRFVQQSSWATTYTHEL